MLRQPKFLANSNAGFTLLETIIALAIMFIALASILAVESNSIKASARTKQLNIVAMLAKNTMVETEYKFQGKTFDEFKAEDGGKFPAPYEDYRWQMKVKEVEFPNISAISGSGAGAGNGTTNEMIELVGKLITNFLSKSVREVTVTIFWNMGTSEKSYSLSTYWVDLNHEFQLSE